MEVKPYDTFIVLQFGAPTFCKLIMTLNADMYEDGSVVEELSGWPGSGKVWNKVDYDKFVEFMKKGESTKFFFNNTNSYFTVKNNRLLVSFSDSSTCSGIEFQLSDDAATLAADFEKLGVVITRQFGVLRSKLTKPTACLLGYKGAQSQAQSLSVSS